MSSGSAAPQKSFWKVISHFWHTKTPVQDEIGRKETIPFIICEMPRKTLSDSNKEEKSLIKKQPQNQVWGCETRKQWHHGLVAVGVAAPF
jgi:hypothetical protein